MQYLHGKEKNMKDIFKRENLILVCFLLVPLSFLSTGILHKSHHLAFIISGLIIVATMIENIWIRSFLWYLAIWQVFILVYKLFVPLLPISIVTASLDTMMFFLVGAMLYYFVSVSKIKIQYFYNTICISVIIQCVIAILQSFKVDPVLVFLNMFLSAYPTLSIDTMTGTLVNNNFLAAYVAISLPFFFRKRWAFFVPVIVYVLIGAKTTSAFVPAIMGSAIYFYDSTTKSRIIIAALAMSGIWYACFYHPFIRATHYNDRLDMWLIALNQVFAHPFTSIFGIGPGASWNRPYPMHNEWVQCLHQFGLLGLSALSGYVVTIYRKNRMLFSAFIIAAINMFGNYPIHLAPSAFLIIIISGLIERERLDNGKISI
jgi:hypothetical protein